MELRYFDANNISIETRAPKASFFPASGNVVGTLSHDWAEPQTGLALMLSSTTASVFMGSGRRTTPPEC